MEALAPEADRCCGFCFPWAFQDYGRVGGLVLIGVARIQVETHGFPGESMFVRIAVAKGCPLGGSYCFDGDHGLLENRAYEHRRGWFRLVTRFVNSVDCDQTSGDCGSPAGRSHFYRCMEDGKSRPVGGRCLPTGDA